MSYYIYLIEGKKIGCTANIKQRAYDLEISEEDFQILEAHEDIDVASQREIELQLEYFGKRDSSRTYASVVEYCSEGGKTGGKTTGKIHKESGHWQNLAKLGGQAAGQKNIESGHMASLQKFEYKRAGGLAGGKKGGTVTASKIHTCPHCGRVGKGAIMYRFHYDKCKHKLQ